MTEKEKELLEFISERIEATGIAPTFTEMGEAMGIASKSSIMQRVEGLIAQGYLVRRERVRRGLALATPNLARVPTSHLRAELERRGRDSGR